MKKFILFTMIFYRFSCVAQVVKQNTEHQFEEGNYLTYDFFSNDNISTNHLNKKQRITLNINQDELIQIMFSYKGRIKELHKKDTTIAPFWLAFYSNDSLKKILNTVFISKNEIVSFAKLPISSNNLYLHLIRKDHSSYSLISGYINTDDMPSVFDYLQKHNFNLLGSPFAKGRTFYQKTFYPRRSATKKAILQDFLLWYSIVV